MRFSESVWVQANGVRLLIPDICQPIEGCMAAVLTSNASSKSLGRLVIINKVPSVLIASDRSHQVAVDVHLRVPSFVTSG